ncbi:FUSC family protein [Mycolicibacterium sp. P9-64]|uniref:FUSC family protein n=1 Tax=Mycolicibacterium sp. P9-64 TaxID=2024612 RepID=UPI0011F01020|nr:FUSC family protein [Mycolicibacterium sp. P9-64]KAA0075760.1 FUSC family protein [Mycolicibacterium sp. P9-64]
MRSPATRQRLAELFGPVGRARWGMAAWLAAALCAILVASDALGHAEWGSSVALGFVLTAVPSLPEQLRGALATVAVRGLTLVVAAVVVALTAASPIAHGVTIVVAAVFGALVERVGATAGLAVVLIAVDAGTTAGATSPWPYAAGAVAVTAAWLGWCACARVFQPDRRADSEPPPSAVGVACGHAIRVGVAVGCAVVIAGLLPDDLVGGHWLITSVLLTIQPRRAQTGVRMAQRLSGNTVGAGIAAVILGAQPPAPVVVAVTMILFVLAMALRPVNYTWWAVTGPPVLLVISEYPGLFPWYEGGIRLAMNLAGAVIVLVVVFGTAWLIRLRPTANAQYRIVYPKMFLRSRR